MELIHVFTEHLDGISMGMLSIAGKASWKPKQCKTSSQNTKWGIFFCCLVSAMRRTKGRKFYIFGFANGVQSFKIIKDKYGSTKGCRGKNQKNKKTTLWKQHFCHLWPQNEHFWQVSPAHMIAPTISYLQLSSIPFYKLWQATTTAQSCLCFLLVLIVVTCLHQRWPFDETSDLPSYTVTIPHNAIHTYFSSDLHLTQQLHLSSSQNASTPPTFFLQKHMQYWS